MENSSVPLFLSGSLLIRLCVTPLPSTLSIGRWHRNQRITAKEPGSKSKVSRDLKRNTPISVVVFPFASAGGLMVQFQGQTNPRRRDWAVSPISCPGPVDHVPERQVKLQVKLFNGMTTHVHCLGVHDLTAFVVIIGFFYACVITFRGSLLVPGN